MSTSSNTSTLTLTDARRRAVRASADTREHDREALRHPRLRALLHRLRAAAPTNIGLPAAVDIDYRPLAPMLDHLLNNVGDPDTDPTYPGHAKDLKRDVVTFFGDLFHAPPDRFGYVTSGGTESNLYALYLARSRHPDGIVPHSAAAHPVDRTSAEFSRVSETARRFATPLRNSVGVSGSSSPTPRPAGRGVRDVRVLAGLRRREDNPAQYSP